VTIIAEIMHEIESTGDADIERAIGSSRIVAVYCWAPWCGPCKVMTPTIEALAGDYKDVKFYKLNADDNPNVASQFHMRSIPVIFVFVDGRLAEEIVGAAPRKYIEGRLKRHLMS
jgi:thioredoxin